MRGTFGADGRGGTRRIRRAGARDRRHQCVAAAWCIDDVAGTRSSVAQCLAQRCHVEAQAAFVDRHVGPDPGEQIGLADDLAGAFGEGDEDVESAAADVNRYAIAFEQPFVREQPEWAE